LAWTDVEDLAVNTPHGVFKARVNAAVFALADLFAGIIKRVHDPVLGYEIKALTNRQFAEFRHCAAPFARAYQI
jgi:hypothetical protein